MNFSYRFNVQADLEAVRDFHLRPDNLRRISPPLVSARAGSGAKLAAGDQIAITIWAGPLPISWTVAIEHAREDEVVDRQVDGPFREWQHRHKFRTLSDGETEIRDEIEYQFRRDPLWNMVGRAMALSLPLLFWYRRRRTQALLRQGL